MISDLRRRIDAVIPDTEDFGYFDGSCALNAGAAVGFVLQFVMDRLPENIKQAAILYYDNTDMKLQDQGIRDEVELERHPQMEGMCRFLLGT